ncbi:cytochrome P450 [Rhodococcus fascians]|uniref:cytochrome P450 n=1 Tax=Rhodococcus sp. NKCM2511 TaxID=2766011 RepID=UPI0019101208|nr:cytochrome P450 [Rhodococcus sp. NKCM2511]MBY3791208.1 cytochrome P450 [Rhodococcus fascians]MBY3823904.1 cytochrome P450 [Rhodococcus fascians]MBY3834426.1 cytochrome P450 [Rhodococcus fascians]MBY3863638.1 cytochrome P450 [Rhodococcus fascians]MBY3883109.1 cytochrome P450 [Rhodococcus fascians]
MTTNATIPQYRTDLYSTDAILDPYPHYARLRALGPVVWLPRQQVFAVSRYADCKAVLLDDVTFISGDGVALNPVANRLGRGTTLNSDGDEHATKRSVLAHRLSPKAVRKMKAAVEEKANSIVDAALSKQFVDGVDDLATALPMSIVPDLVGWPEDGREDLLRWAGATFDSLGPVNRHSITAVKGAAEMLAFSRRVVRDRSVIPGSMGDDVLKAADDNKIQKSTCPALMIDYLGPSLDTTIGAISGALDLFARHPKQWQAIRQDPDLIPNAINEVVRYESPIRAFSRRAVRDVEIDGSRIPKGARVLVVYASANRDEREWDNPDAFDITRDAARQLGFGSGVHGCAGQGLARLEAQTMLRVLAQRVEKFVPAGTPVRAVNNVIHRYERLPLKLVAAEGTQP